MAVHREIDGVFKAVAVVVGTRIQWEMGGGGGSLGGRGMNGKDGGIDE